ncbi:DEAD/DEAH box helicase [Lichenicola cladoniae]|uniref:DEAD/DEAH box helicase n=1 Tax=Lichenicola cladoniae TaxID=1484109 RepID=A0A6M8HQ69_9PROT|nr:DEAD/DEAH box helicase [Lichenicola cladoniae]NPD67888.1 DEAD/DEAH box helicase [Acetobacteraceae bacterium]QKE90488.1 DEAD/DEAH box helicase [Lichenicola cladoniae]
MTDFRSLGLADPLLDALQRAGYTVPTPIQAQAIPPILAGRDVQGIAQTGTGKTAAFALPILHRLLANPKVANPHTCRALILSPTRELASQICDAVRIYARRTKLHVATMYGGVPKPPQSKHAAAGIDILVATPGRLLDHMSGGTISLDETEILVLDEADHMLNLGFFEDVEDIVSQVPHMRQTLLFSATMPPEIDALARRMLHNPLHLAASPEATTADRIEQRVIFVEAGAKRATLIELLKRGRMTRTLVFTRTKQSADEVVEALDKAGIRAASIHGDKSQPQRDRTLASFRKGGFPVLVATDVAARGIDLDGLTHVVNFDLPEVPQAYVHRVGRTARAGAAGIAITLCAAPERPLLRAIEKLLGTRLRVYEVRSAA